MQINRTAKLKLSFFTWAISNAKSRSQSRLTFTSPNHGTALRFHVTAKMSAQPVDSLSGGSAKNTRTLLRVVILGFIAATAIASRLFSVIREY